MSILDTIKRRETLQLRKTIIVYLALSVFCVFFDRVYALFGHGVRSASMSFLFLYPLVAGAVPYLLLWIFKPRREVPGFRLFYNVYNSGIAMLTIQSMLNGIMEIAGTASVYNVIFTICGSILTIAGAAAYLIRRFRSEKKEGNP